MLFIIVPLEPQNIEIYHVILVGLLFLFTYIIISKINNKFKDVLYYREIPDNLHPAIIQYYSDGYINDQSFWLIFLELIQKGYYKFERFEVDNQIEYKIKWMKDDYYDLSSYKLNDYEKLVIKYINTFILSDDRQTKQKDETILLSTLQERIKGDFINLKKLIDKIHSSIRLEIKHSYGFIHKENNIFLAVIFIFAYYILISIGVFNIILGSIYTFIILGVANVLKNTRFNFRGIIGLIILIYTLLVLSSPILFSLMFVSNPVITILLYINPFVIFLASCILSAEIYTPKQAELMKKIKGSKMFLNDFTLLKYRPIDYINFVKYYYVLAEAYNIKITDQDYVNSLYDDETFDTMTADDFSEIIFDDILGSFFKVELNRGDVPLV
ncbi:MAG: DUF2207 domain-containing protein [Bacilli bacterium]|nr:DUF2207 domain-containing protein [Bacilli bacterium]MDD4808902.1 DUF2207 domain-containing protein [Bacilli bacterium]